MNRPRLAVFASGGGSNFQAIVDASKEGRLSADVVLLVASSATIGAVERARKEHIEVVVCARNDDPLPLVASRAIDIIALAGYLRLIPAHMVEQFRNRILNVHPALLPSFGGAGMYGMNVHEAVVAHGVRVSGATVHIVDTEFDSGPIVAQESVPVYPDDSPSDVAARVNAAELHLYPQALQLLAQDRLVVDGRRVSILPPPKTP